MKTSLFVIGGGAAGFFCAINAAKLHPDLKVIIIEKSSKLLSKVRVSGGGRCNVTHACFSISEMVKHYPRGEKFLKKLFHQFFTTDTIEWFESRGVKLKTESDGRMFPITDSSQTIIDCLMQEANKLGVEIRLNTEVKSMTKAGDNFQLQLPTGEEMADFICIACGGYPKAEQFKWLKELGHTIIDPVPSLFTFNLVDKKITALMGISVEKVRIKINGSKLSTEGPMLITHWGFSGPAILKLSAWAARELSDMNYNYSITINWLPQFNENTLREEMQRVRFNLASQKIINRNPFYLPQRLWEYFLNAASINTDLRWADLPAAQQNILVKLLCVGVFQIKGKTTFKEEFVTAGGISLSEVDANTMESKIVPGVFFAGEVLDIDGVTGGFNFQNAWSTGYVAASLRSLRAQIGSSAQ